MVKEGSERARLIIAPVAKWVVVVVDAMRHVAARAHANIHNVHILGALRVCE